MTNSQSSILKISLLIIIILASFKGKGQTLLDADSTQIKKQMLSEGAKQHKSHLQEELD